MTAEEAKNQIKIYYNNPNYYVEMDALLMAIEALEKQIPIQPNRILAVDDNDNADVICPCCDASNTTAVKRIKSIYCWNCGKKIEY